MSIIKQLEILKTASALHLGFARGGEKSKRGFLMSYSAGNITLCRGRSTSLASYGLNGPVVNLVYHMDVDCHPHTPSRSTRGISARGIYWILDLVSSKLGINILTENNPLPYPELNSVLQMYLSDCAIVTVSVSSTAER